MLFPLAILFCAAGCCAVTAYGADPRWVMYRHGLEMILLSRRLQWPLIAVALLACGALIGGAAAGKWRAWWLLGLAPVLALFGHRFLTDPARDWQVDAEAQFVTADQASFVAADDYVVGLTFDGDAYAYPYSVLYQNPVVAQAIPRRRLVLIWSAFANRAVATETDWTVKPRDLEIVSAPANSLLVYNSRLGEFINGITGLTPDGKKPVGFGRQVETEKMTWKQWVSLHGQTFVLRAPDGQKPSGPTQALAPRYPTPGLNGPVTQVAFIDTPRPTAVREGDVTAAPLNLVEENNPLLLFRKDGQIEAFLRQANGDLTPRFFPMSAAAHPAVAFTELDSNTDWAADGRAVQGPLKGEKLKPYGVDDGVYLEVMRYWYPDLAMIVPTAADVGQAPRASAAAKRSTRARGRRRPARRTARATGRGLGRGTAVTASF